MKNRLFRFNVNKVYMTYVSLFFTNFMEIYAFKLTNQLFYAHKKLFSASTRE